MKDILSWHRVPWGEAKTAPCKAGCYALIAGTKQVLYIGRSKLLWNRLHCPSRHTGFCRTQIPVTELYIAWDTNEYDSEQELIKLWKPILCKCVRAT